MMLIRVSNALTLCKRSQKHSYGDACYLMKLTASFEDEQRMARAANINRQLSANCGSTRRTAMGR